MSDLLDDALAAQLGRPLYDAINKHLADGQRAEAAIARVRKATANSFMAGPNAVDVVRVADVLAALDIRPDTTPDIPADKNGSTIVNAQVEGGEAADNEADTTPACWLCLDKGALAIHNNASEQFGRPLWTAHKPTSLSHPVTPCPACRASDGLANNTEREGE